MPPKRRSAPTAAAAAAPVPRASKRAKEHSLNAAQESEILEAYQLFCIADPTASPPKKRSSTAKPDLDSTAIRTGDVRRCLIALNAPPADGEELAEILETLDPEQEGFVRFEHFFAVAALKVNSRSSDGAEEDEDEEEEEVVGRKGKAKGKGKEKAVGRGSDAEVRTAFGLFTRGEGEMITLAHLRRVAKELREEVDDKMLKDMIREANGGGKAGVDLDEFGDVMQRAGVFG